MSSSTKSNDPSSGRGGYNRSQATYPSPPEAVNQTPPESVPIGCTRGLYHTEKQEEPLRSLRPQSLLLRREAVEIYWLDSYGALGR